MPLTDADLVELRRGYEAAYDAHQSCLDVLADVERRGERPPPDVLADEANALRQLNEARSLYRDALFEVAFVGDDRSP